MSSWLCLHVCIVSSSYLSVYAFYICVACLCCGQPHMAYIVHHLCRGPATDDIKKCEMSREAREMAMTLFLSPSDRLLGGDFLTQRLYLKKAFVLFARY